MSTGEQGVIESLSTAATRDIRRFAVLMCILNLLIPLGLLAYAFITGRRFWLVFWGEDNLITWFSSLQLVLVALTAYLNLRVAALWRQLSGEESRKYWIWLVFALGFLFLALDERFEIHEALREGIIAQHGEVSIIPWARPADIGLYLYLVIGLMMGAFLVSELRVGYRGLLLFGLAVAVAASVTVVDSLPKDLTRQWPLEFRRFLTSVFEESGEIWAQLLFLLSFLSVLKQRLTWLGGLADDRVPPP